MLWLPLYLQLNVSTENGNRLGLETERHFCLLLCQHCLGCVPFLGRASTWGRGAPIKPKSGPTLMLSPTCASVRPIVQLLLRL